MSMEIQSGQFSDADVDIECCLNDEKTRSDEVTRSDEEQYDQEQYEEDSEDDDWWDDVPINKRQRNITVNKLNVSNKQKTSLQPQDKQFGKYVNKIKLDKYEGPLLNGKIATSFQEISKKHYAQKCRVKDRKDRATVEQVLDPRTKMILFKLLNKGIINEINGCISTGKEANVYHASTTTGYDRAVKIFKTSILVFKDRDKYVTGEFRFRHGYCKGNPRKMVRTWAEKEMRNLLRMHAVGIPCPEPIILRNHVLVMEFVGSNGFPAPLLKDANITESKARELYLLCVRIMRDLYWKAKLVHADLSEFNILYDIVKDRMTIIDVSQSVEHDHPSALLFLRKDCANINEFFRKQKVCVMTVKELFDFITDLNVTDENIEDYLEHAQRIAAERTDDDVTQKDLVNAEVFKNAFIPQRLDDVVDFERDVAQAEKGNTEHLYYTNVVGMKKDLTVPKSDVIESEEECDDSTDSSSSDNSGGECERESEKIVKSTKELRKEHKKLVKEENREKRKEKMPKHVKKRKEKMTKGGKKK